MKQIKNILFILIIIILSTFGNFTYAEDTYDDSASIYEESNDDFTAQNEEETNSDTFLNEDDTEGQKLSSNIIYVEIFCGIIGVIMLIMANKTTD